MARQQWGVVQSQIHLCTANTRPLQKDPAARPGTAAQPHTVACICIITHQQCAQCLLCAGDDDVVQGDDCTSGTSGVGQPQGLTVAAQLNLRLAAAAAAACSHQLHEQQQARARLVLLQADALHICRHTLSSLLYSWAP
jgi:hypothetical protein